MRNVTVTNMMNHELNASVLQIENEGRKYWHGRAVFWDPDDQKDEPGYLTKFESSHYRILADGMRHDIVRAIREAHDVSRQRIADHEHAFDRARWAAMNAWEETWRAEHPSPVVPTVDEIIAALKVTS